MTVSELENMSVKELRDLARNAAAIAGHKEAALEEESGKPLCSECGNEFAVIGTLCDECDHAARMHKQYGSGVRG
jgi:hypothetical protein